jgi:hypothetical protein
MVGKPLLLVVVGRPEDVAGHPPGGVDPKARRRPATNRALAGRDFATGRLHEPPDLIGA